MPIASVLLDCLQRAGLTDVTAVEPVEGILATVDGRPAVIDPAISYTWAEVDLANLWCSPHPPEAKRFFDVYAELTGLDDDWRARMPFIQLPQHLAVIAQFDHDWGAAQQVRAILKPFRR